MLQRRRPAARATAASSAYTDSAVDVFLAAYLQQPDPVMSAPSSEAALSDEAAALRTSGPQHRTRMMPARS